MEGTGSYGGLRALLRQRGVRVVEVVRPSRQHRRNRGKSDLIDAEAAARGFLGGEATAQPRGGDAAITMIRSLRVAREAMVNQRTQTINQLRALMVTAPPELRQSLVPLSASRLIKRVARFRIDSIASSADASRFALRQPGRHVRALKVQIDELNDRLTPLVANRAPSCSPCMASVSRLPATCSSRGTTLSGSGQRRLLRHSVGSLPSLRRPETHLDTGSVEEATGARTALSGALF
jgi:transposase